MSMPSSTRALRVFTTATVLLSCGPRFGEIAFTSGSRTLQVGQTQGYYMEVQTYAFNLGHLFGEEYPMRIDTRSGDESVATTEGCARGGDSCTFFVTAISVGETRIDAVAKVGDDHRDYFLDVTVVP